jgi:hypothetical protein
MNLQWKVDYDIVEIRSNQVPMLSTSPCVATTTSSHPAYVRTMGALSIKVPLVR